MVHLLVAEQCHPDNFIALPGAFSLFNLNMPANGADIAEDPAGQRLVDDDHWRLVVAHRVEVAALK